MHAAEGAFRIEAREAAKARNLAEEKWIVEVGLRIVALAVAAMTADIEAAPAPRGNGRRRCFEGQIGGEGRARGGQCHDRDACK